LSNNRIVRIPKRVIMSQVVKLNLSMNKIESIKNLNYNFPSLEILRVK